MSEIKNNTMNIRKMLKLDKANTNVLYGLNPTYSDEIVFADTAYKTHIFFTRPQLNLTNSNCILSNELIKLMTDNKNSIHRYTRLMLDPRLTHSTAKYESDLVDPYNPFIPIFSNLVNKVSGWPDIVMATKTSKEGHMKEQTVFADGATEYYSVFDLDLSFKNIAQEPITTIFGVWLEYMDKVHKGHLMPYLDMIIRREVDYMSRIYIIITGESDNIIKKIANTGAGFPVSNPMGMFFDYSKDENQKTKIKDINIRFKCVGAEYNKHNSMLDFNTLVAAFHPNMKKLHKGEADNGMVEVPEDLFKVFKYRMYPYIDLATNRLLWYIEEKYIEYIQEKSGELNDIQ